MVSWRGLEGDGTLRTGLLEVAGVMRFGDGGERGVLDELAVPGTVVTSRSMRSLLHALRERVVSWGAGRE